MIQISSKDFQDTSTSKVTPLETDTSSFQVLGAKTLENLNQEKVSNSWESNKGQHGTSTVKPHSLSFDSINNQINQIYSLNNSEKKEGSSVQDETTNELVKEKDKGGQASRPPKESVNDRYTRLMDLLKNEPQAITHL